MQRHTLTLGLSTSVVGLFLFVMILSGCGGGGTVVADGDLNAQFAALLSPAQRASAYVGSQVCADCHNAAGDPKYNHWQQTYHAQVNVGCEGCHGPGGAHVAANRAGAALQGDALILAGRLANSPYVCGQCHNEGAMADGQYTAWAHSPHSHVVEDTVGSNRTCIRCHISVFHNEQVITGNDVDAIPASELTAYANFFNEQLDAGDPHKLINSADCVSCHKPHEVTGNVVKNGKDAQVRHAVYVDPTDTEEIAKIGPGATPTQYSTFDHACGKCHNGRGANPSDAGLNAATSRPSMHDSNQFNMLVGMSAVEGDTPPVRRFMSHATIEKQCVSCHMGESGHGHSFTAKTTSCVPCHSAADAANRIAVTKNDTIERLATVLSRLRQWGIDTSGNVNGWEYSALGGPSTQTTIPIQIKRARHNYYFVIRDLSFGVHNGPYARHLLDEAHRQMDNIPSFGSTRVTKDVKKLVAEFNEWLKADKAKSKSRMD